VPRHHQKCRRRPSDSAPCAPLLTVKQKKVGVLAKDQGAGPFVDEWKAAFAEIEKDVEEFDVTNAISTAALSVKDEKELVCQRCPSETYDN
jgi:nucleosome binding factor SPN SPT16 subunit